MPLTNEEQKLILTIVGKADIRDLNDELGREQRNVIALTELLRAGGIQQDAYNLTVSASAQNITRLNTNIQAIEKSTHNWSVNAMGLSYALNDVFSAGGGVEQKIMSMANNMPMLLAGFGGWGLALSAIIPMMTALGPLIREAYKAWAGDDHTKAVAALDKLKEKIKEIEKSPIKFAVDQHQLDVLKAQMDEMTKGQAGAKAFGELTDDFEQASGGAVRKAIGNAEGGSAGVKRKVLADLVKQFEADDTTLNDLLGKAAQADAKAQAARKMLDSGILPNEEAVSAALAEEQRAKDEAKTARDEASSRRLGVGKNAENELGKLYSGATAGDADAQSRLVDLLHKTGQSGLANKIEENGPERFRNANEAAKQNQQAKDDKAAKETLEANDKTKRDAENEKQRAHQAEQDADRARVTQTINKEIGDELKRAALEGIAGGNQAGAMKSMNAAGAGVAGRNFRPGEIDPAILQSAIEQTSQAAFDAARPKIPQPVSIPNRANGAEPAPNTKTVTGRIQAKRAQFAAAKAQKQMQLNAKRQVKTERRMMKTANRVNPNRRPVNQLSDIQPRQTEQDMARQQLDAMDAKNGKESTATAQAKYFAQVAAENQRLQAEIQGITRQFGAATNQLRQQGNMQRNDQNRLIPNTW